MDYGNVMGRVYATVGCPMRSFVLYIHCCVSEGLVLSLVHLAWLMGRLLLLVSFPTFNYLLGLP